MDLDYYINKLESIPWLQDYVKGNEWPSTGSVPKGMAIIANWSVFTMYWPGIAIYALVGRE